MPPRHEDKENSAPNLPATSQLRRGKTIEQIYQKKTQLEHVLLRPDTYVGSTEQQSQDMFVVRKGEIVYKKIDFVPALYKIFDEILVNAADNMMRDPKGMTLVDVSIDQEAGCISVMNNGKGIPVVMHKEHNCWVPELIFGHLLTGDNYDDTEKKVTGGRNGYGAKLTNVFSTKFIIETADRSVKKKFVQVMESNMSVKQKPKITDYSGQDYTKVTFWPDLARFGMKKLDADIVGLMMKRAYDIAGSTAERCKVVLNGQHLKHSNFEQYVQLYLSDANKADDAEGPAPIIYERCNPRWEVAISVSDGSFQQVSFVNSINTIKGGTHVNYITDQLVEAISKVVKSKNRGGIDIKPQHIKNHLWVFVNCLVENPAFDSQTKETLTTKAAKFGSMCELSDKTIKQVLKSGVVEMILDWAKAKQKVDLGRQLKGGTKNVTRVLGVPKLEDANDAGGKNSEDCTLILTEGDSAKSLAVAGLSIVGRDKYGVFPLKGKVLNVREANFKQVTENKEIQNIMKIMGLDIKKDYSSSRSGLRYGSIMIMTDQDFDGSHIKGLLINLIHHWWPSLLQGNGFVKEFITPIVKVWKEGKKDSERKDERSFFSVEEYQKWKRRTQNGRGWKAKYYKGLGTSTAKEAKEYFKDIENHEIAFRWKDNDDGEAIDLAFNRKRADDRKEWINSYEDGTHVDHTQSKLTYYDFVHKELVQFAKYDVSRSVPSMVDGLKTSQRKVLFCAFKKKLKHDIKVAQFVGYISEQSAYHHGEVSLENTIINLAQNYVGANNVNLLVPSGQFGTRLQGGRDHAAARYIYTRLQSITRLIFQSDDDAILKYLDDEGQPIEPNWYCPVLPTVLVNGAEGIAVGWSCSVPNYNPRDIIRNLRKYLRGETMQDMSPWYKGFKGSIVANESEPGKFDVCGCLEKKSDTTIVISELPLRRWTQDYKEFLEGLMPQEGGKKSEEASPGTITDFREFHTENTVHFEVTMSHDQMKEAEKVGLEKLFKMKSSLATTNMVLFDAEGKIAKYESALDILKDFCAVRRRTYDARKAHLVAKLTREKEVLSNKARFILMVVKGEIELRKRKKVDLLKELQKKGFKPMSELDAIVSGGAAAEKPEAGGNEEAAAEGAEAADEAAAEKSDYDYLLNMNLWSLTYEKVEEIKKQHEIKEQELNVLKKTTIEQMWDQDLQAVSRVLDEIAKIEAEEAEAAASFAEGRRKKDASRQGAARHKPAPKPRKRAADDDDDTDLLKRPLTATSAAGSEVQKSTWGSGGPAVRQNTANDDEEPEPTTGPSQQKRARGRPRAASKDEGGVAAGQPAAEEDGQTPKWEEPLPPPKDEDGAGLLSRLLSRNEKSASSKPAPAFSSFSALGGSDDIFSYLKETAPEGGKPFSLLDSAGSAPAMEFSDLPGGSTAGAAEAGGAEAAEQQPRRGRGRPKAAAKADGGGGGDTLASNGADVADGPKRRKVAKSSE